MTYIEDSLGCWREHRGPSPLFSRNFEDPVAIWCLILCLAIRCGEKAG